MTTVHTFDGPTGARIQQDDDERWWFVVDPILIACVAFITGLGRLVADAVRTGERLSCDGGERRCPADRRGCAYQQFV